MNLIRAHKIEFLLVILSLVVHFAVFAFVVNANDDSVLKVVRADDGYFELAQNVLAGNGFSWSEEAPYAPNPLRTPGYVYVLAGLIGIAGVTGAAIIQLIAASAIPVLGMHIARTISGLRSIGIFTGIILAIDPTLALLSFQFYTDTLFLLLFLPWILLTLQYFKRRDMTTLVVSAILLGLATLVRPVPQYIPLLMIPFILWHFGTSEWRRGLMHAGVYLLIVGAILTPWTIRNTQIFGVPGLSAQTPFVLYTNLAPAVRSVALGTDFQDEVDAFLTPAEYKGDAITLANGDTYTKKAIDVVLSYPLATTYVMIKSLFTFFTNDGFYALLTRSGHIPANFLPLLIVARLVWIAITLTAFVGVCVQLARRLSPSTIFITLMVAYFALTSLIAAFGTNPRYRLPVDPIILAMAAIGTMYAIVHVQRLRKFLTRKNVT